MATATRIPQDQMRVVTTENVRDVTCRITEREGVETQNEVIKSYIVRTRPVYVYVDQPDRVRLEMSLEEAKALFEDPWYSPLHIHVATLMRDALAGVQPASPSQGGTSISEDARKQAEKDARFAALYGGKQWATTDSGVSGPWYDQEVKR